MTVPCASLGCTTNDVVTGLAQVSVQLQGLSALITIVAALVVVLLVLVAVFTFAAVR